MQRACCFTNSQWELRNLRGTVRANGGLIGGFPASCWDGWFRPDFHTEFRVTSSSCSQKVPGYLRALEPFSRLTSDS